MKLLLKNFYILLFCVCSLKKINNESNSIDRVNNTFKYSFSPYVFLKWTSNTPVIVKKTPSLINLEELEISVHNIQRLPLFIKNLKNLKILRVYSSENLQKFNDRKDDIKSMPLDQFIKEHYPNAYDRFYVKMLKTRRVSIRDFIQALHPNIDISELVNLGTNVDYIGPYSRVFTEILKLYNYPVILNRFPRITNPNPPKYLNRKRGL